MPQDDSKYTKPALRESIKKRVMAGSKGGKPGQWSARKAQLTASEYKKAGGKKIGRLKKNTIRTKPRKPQTLQKKQRKKGNESKFL
jgi:hypothetical protein